MPQTDVRFAARFLKHCHGSCRPGAIVRSGSVRFTVVTSRLIRIEYSPGEIFEDRPSQVFICRRQPVPHFTAKTVGGVLTIDTGRLALRWNTTTEGLSAESLSVRLEGSRSPWHFGDRDTGNLGGTARTLDGCDGPRPLHPGLMSRGGITMFDDTTSLVFTNEGWPAPRNAPGGYLDLYLFAYGSDYQACLRDYAKVCGEVPTIPRWALGNWWSRNWVYSEESLNAVVDEFAHRDIPLSVCIMDMDWHIVKNPHHGGWTGYSWNRDLFPAPRRVLARLHRDNGLRVGVNLHPADGVHPHEDRYEAMARHAGIDPRSRRPVEFRIDDPHYTRGYFDILHRPLEDDGVDFFWMDWQQGESTAMRGLDPLWWLNHLHSVHRSSRGNRRPFVFSRWGGPGAHRYPIGFSGDTHATWQSLAFQPRFTATAANVAFTWWSHDIGGYMGGDNDPELYTRWVQFGVFSPVMRLHGYKQRFAERAPWRFDPATCAVVTDALRLRHSLIPYLYTMARLTETDAKPLVRPMYYTHADCPDSYLCPDQYWFGTELIAAPYTSPRDPDTRLARRAVWLPAGDWYDFATGMHYPGERWHAVYGDIGHVPVFAKAGAIVPMAGALDAHLVNQQRMVLRAYAGGEGRFDLYEDQGDSLSYRDGECCVTTLAQHCTTSRAQVTIGPARGKLSLIPPRRTWEVRLYGVVNPDTVSVAAGRRKPRPESVVYDAARGCVTVKLPGQRVDRTIVVTVDAGRKPITARADRRREHVLDLVSRFALPVDKKGTIEGAFRRSKDTRELLARVRLVTTDGQFRLVTEALGEAGIHKVDAAGGVPPALVLWNYGKPRAASFSLFAWKRHFEEGPLKGRRIIDLDKTCERRYRPCRWETRVRLADAGDVIETGTTV